MVKIRITCISYSLESLNNLDFLNMSNILKYVIFGAGGFAKEAMLCLEDMLASGDSETENTCCFAVDDQYYDKEELLGRPVIKKSELNFKKCYVVIAVGDPVKRKKIVDSLPLETCFFNIIHPSASISRNCIVGLGSIITHNTVLTCDIEIGKHAHININATIGHDTKIGDFFTCSPGVNISGNCTIKDFVYIGTNASLKENTTICDSVTIGMGSSVIKDITEAGVYIGTPSRKLN
ncbi:MAG: sugar O-acyltransferase (sialic acid O-acetyltransferase NeuD family) [Flavobacteriales bacterium]|jgi:sugar O-acyltransferase (sialic acid O-acetyltransferase NeuD family)